MLTSTGSTLNISYDSFPIFRISMTAARYSMAMQLLPPTANLMMFSAMTDKVSLCFYFYWSADTTVS